MIDITLSDILQFFVGFSILWIWLVNSHVATNFRVGGATTLREEVIEVGFPNWVYDILRVVKPFFAFFLMIGLLVWRRPHFLCWVDLVCTFMLKIAYLK